MTLDLTAPYAVFLVVFLAVAVSWSPVAGDDRHRHYITATDQPDWWREARGGAGPAVGPSTSDERLAFCTTCLPVDHEAPESER